MMLTSCVDDSIEPLTPLSDQPHFTISTLKGSQLEGQGHLQQALAAATEQLNMTRYKAYHDTINNFVIDDSRVNYLVSEDYESYAYGIYSTDTTQLKNLMFSKKADSTYQAYLVQYDLTQMDFVSLQNGVVQPNDAAHVTYTPITTGFNFKMDVEQRGTGDCVSFVAVSEPRTCNGRMRHTDPNDPDCTASEKARESILVMYMQPCGGAGAATGGTGSSDTGNINTTGGTGGSSAASDTETGTNTGSDVDTNVTNTNTTTSPCDRMLMSDGSCGDATAIVLSHLLRPVSAATTSFFNNLPMALRDFINDPEQNELRNALDELFTSYPNLQLDRVILESAMNELSMFDENNYPGKDDNFPYDWWSDDYFVENMISFDIDTSAYDQLTDLEKTLVQIFPFQALQIKLNVDIAQTETFNRMGNNGRNDKSDAFRHAFFNAMNSNDAGDFIARLFSFAHETEVPSNLVLEVQMDYFNNDKGHVIGDAAGMFVTDVFLSNQVYNLLLNGDLRYLSPLDLVMPPNYGINSATSLIPTNI